MKFEETVIKSWPTGSRYICSPPVMDTDRDTVILVNGFYPYDELLEGEGWEHCANDEYNKEGDFVSYRKGEDNYIITEDEDFFNQYVIATEAAKVLNLTNKEDRIKLFRAVRHHDDDYYTGMHRHWELKPQKVVKWFEVLGDVVPGDAIFPPAPPPLEAPF